MTFTNKTVLVTGASRGIGKATAEEFARLGARVAINYHAHDKAAENLLQILPGGTHLRVQADVGDPEQVRLMMEKVIGEFGRLDIVVNNAGIFEHQPVDIVGYEAWQAIWRRTLSVNLEGAANVCFFAAQHMMRQGGGKIINISSRGAFRGEPDHPAYGASKAGLNALSQSLAQKLAPYNIHVFVLAPGWVDTDMAAPGLSGPQGDTIRAQSPLNRAAKPSEMAHAITFLASDRAAYATGAILDMNGASYLR